MLFAIMYLVSTFHTSIYEAMQTIHQTVDITKPDRRSTFIFMLKDWSRDRQRKVRSKKCINRTQLRRSQLIGGSRRSSNVECILSGTIMQMLAYVQREPGYNCFASAREISDKAQNTLDHEKYACIDYARVMCSAEA